MNPSSDTTTSSPGPSAAILNPTTEVKAGHRNFARYALAPTLLTCALLTACGSAGTGTGASTTLDSSSSSNTPASAFAGSASTSSASTVPATTTAQGPIAGTWNGTYTSRKYPSTTGPFLVTFTQNGTKIAGAITISSACISKGTIDGTLSGQTIGFGTVQGTSTITFDGTISGTAISGTYTSGPSCGSDNGTWNANR